MGKGVTVLTDRLYGTRED